MNVTIIGAGNMGRGIGSRLVAGGHNLTIVNRDPAEARRLADELRSGARGGAKVEAGDAGDPRGEVVVLAVYYPADKEIVRQLGDKLAGKVVVDISNPIDPTTFEPATAPGISAAEEAAALVPAGTQVVKAFNTTFAGTLTGGSVAGEPLDVFIAGDAAEAKEKVAALARDGGLRPIDAGPLRRAQQLEALGFIHNALQDKLNTNYSSALKIIDQTK